MLNNASNNSQPGGRIRLDAERLGNEVEIRVKDNGRGIRSEMLTRIFDLFVQVDRTLDRSTGGPGIGLSLVKQLVELHGGKCSAHSEGVGHGSEFLVKLPVLAETAGFEPQSKLPAAVEGPGLRLLIAEDNPDTAKTLSMPLLRLGHQVVISSDGPAALQEAIAHPPDVIIADIGLPKLNGYEIAQRIRERKELIGIVLIALTGYGQPEDRARTRQVGFNHRLVKPVAIEDLQASLLHVHNADSEGP